ncbi:nucleotide disphospho-sugar-binding domain-containing protein [Amycolatopsis orientalis]|uniref:nucleotide disphospho-sugar-binding domain-containing protein n=1 Tax=Amycolatopsis orientalis TaxID=31958 RepID=UPI00039FF543|nr:nucleotide disphospho-sugar-binding domain-containing protein [Amycolatopsis orientalis]
MKILFATAPGHGLTLPLIPVVWAARAAGHDVLLATTAEIAEVSARAGLPVADVFPGRDIWTDLLAAVKGGAPDPDEPEEYRIARQYPGPFGLFTAAMTEGTIEAGRAFGADLVVYPSDHGAGGLAAVALGVPALEVGNRISWSARDRSWRTEHDDFFGGELVTLMREKLGLGDAPPNVLARIDPRAPSMGGLRADEAPLDERDGAPWWPMRFVPYNGGAVLPEWVLRKPDRPRVAVTLGTVVPAMSGVSSLKVVLDALGGMDVEVILAAGTADLSELGELPGNVRSVGYLPLSVFLPGCAAIVHHGGSGTTAAPLFYGVPQLVLPSFADNPMSAERVVERGVGLSHDPATADVPAVRKLVSQLLEDETFRKAAAEVRTEMSEQPTPADVLARAVAALR